MPGRSRRGCSRRGARPIRRDCSGRCSTTTTPATPGDPQPPCSRTRTTRGQETCAMATDPMLEEPETQALTLAGPPATIVPATLNDIAARGVPMAVALIEARSVIVQTAFLRALSLIFPSDVTL